MRKGVTVTGEMRTLLAVEPVLPLKILEVGCCEYVIRPREHLAARSSTIKNAAAPSRVGQAQHLAHARKHASVVRGLRAGDLKRLCGMGCDASMVKEKRRGP